MTEESNHMHKFSLIDGVFDPDEAREILLHIYSAKINFHEMKNFSSKIRFGKEDHIAVQRIPKLKESISQLLQLIDEAKLNNAQLVIASEISISGK